MTLRRRSRVPLIAIAASAVVGDDAPSWLLVTTLALFGLGLGVATPSIMPAGIEAAPERRIGTAAGVLSASRYVGSIAATLVLASVVSDDGEGLSLMLSVCAATLVAALACARWLPGRRSSTLELVG